MVKSRRRRGTVGKEEKQLVVNHGNVRAAECAHTHSCPAGRRKEEVQRRSASGLACYFGEADKPHDTTML